MMKIGLYGGSFNPVHLGHVDLAIHIISLFSLDFIIFIPVYNPPHKSMSSLASFEDRCAMLKLALFEEKKMMISEIEKHIQGKSYTYNTVNEFLKFFPNEKFYYLLGEDSYDNIKTWYNWENLLNLVEFIVVKRSDYSGKKTSLDSKNLPKNIHFVDIPIIPASSTNIRASYKEGNIKHNYMNKDVNKYILDKKLYQGL